MTDAANSLDLTRIRVLPLTGKSCLDRFDCGNHDINGYATKAHKWADQNRSKIFSAHLDEAAWGLGFYSLSFKLEDGKKFGSREADLYRGAGAPIVYLDALAVRHQYQSCGLGTMLLIDSLRRAHLVSQHVAVYGVGLRSLNDKTTAFYERHGFGVVESTKNPLMVIPIWTVNDLFQAR